MSEGLPSSLLGLSGFFGILKNKILLSSEELTVKIDVESIRRMANVQAKLVFLTNKQRSSYLNPPNEFSSFFFFLECFRSESESSSEACDRFQFRESFRDSKMFIITFISR